LIEILTSSIKGCSSMNSQKQKEVEGYHIIAWKIFMYHTIDWKIFMYHTIDWKIFMKAFTAL